LTNLTSQTPDKSLESLKAKITTNRSKNDCNLGFFYIVIGIIFEVKDDMEGAIGYFWEGLGVFEKAGDQLFMVLIIDHMLRVYEACGMCDEDVGGYENLGKVYQGLLGGGGFGGSDLGGVFRNFEQRIGVCKTLARDLGILEKKVRNFLVILVDAGGFGGEEGEGG
jgi:hypothetical protein